MASLLAVFLVELFAFRIGTAKLKAAGLGAYDAHGHDGPSHASHGPEMRGPPTPPVDDIEAASVNGDLSASSSDVKHGAHSHDPALAHALEHADHQGDVLAQILGVAILEFGVVFHSIFIGLTLATDPSFTILFIVRRRL
jgi:zinc transporter 1/2/3